MTEDKRTLYENLMWRAAESKRWAWMPGMHTPDALVVSTDEHDKISEVVFDGRLMSARAQDTGEHGDWYDTRGAMPDLFSDATIGCIENGLLRVAWSSVGERIVIEVIADHMIDKHEGVLSAGVRCRVLVWTPTSWREHWTSAVYSDRVSALIECLEAAP